MIWKRDWEKVRDASGNDESLRKKIIEIFGRSFKENFALTSVMLSIANGLLIIFELGYSEFGAVVLIIGVLLGIALYLAFETPFLTTGLRLFCSTFVLFSSEAGLLWEGRVGLIVGFALGLVFAAMSMRYTTRAVRS